MKKLLFQQTYCLTKIFSIFLLLLLFSTDVSASTQVLRGNQTIDVVSYQSHLICPDAKLLQFIKQTIDEGKSNWDIIGFQEFRNGVGRTKPSCFAQQKFLEEARAIGLQYNCVHQQTPNIDDLHLSICSRFPLKVGTYKETIIHFAPERPRLVQCVEVLVPGNPIIFCNLHTRISEGQELPVHQLARALPFILNDVIPSLIPTAITNAQDRELYRLANLGRTILVGDFNQSVKPMYPFISACRIANHREDCFRGSSGIDHITTINMLDPNVISSPELRKEFLVPEFFYRHNELDWPTDHVGPVFSRIHIQPMSIDLLSAGPTGYIDEVNGNDCYITGWSCDMNKPTQPLDIHVYHTRLESNNFIGSTKANMPRTDVADAGKCNGHPNTGFLFKLPYRYRDGVTRSIHLHALGINVDGSKSNNNPPLTGSPIILTCKKVTPTPTPTPSPTPPPQPIEGDLNNDGVVNQTDYNLMVTNLYTNNCAFTVPRRTSACEVSIGDLNRLIRLMRR